MKKSPKKYNMKHNIIITGATSGIGLSCATLCCSHGMRVFGVSRKGSCEAYSHDLLSLYKMDVTDEKSVSTVIPLIQKEAIRTTGQGIDTIIHCAGYGIAGSAEDTPIERVKEQFETNFFGVLRVNSIVLPFLREQQHSKIIVLGSIAGRISIPFQSHYSASKYAVEAYIEALRMECKDMNVVATIVEAGDTATPFNQHRIYYGPIESPYRIRGEKAVAKMVKDENKGYSPDVVAKRVYNTLITKNPPPRVVVGCSYMMLMLLKRILPDRIVERIISTLYLS